MTGNTIIVIRTRVQQYFANLTAKKNDKKFWRLFASKDGNPPSIKVCFNLGRLHPFLENDQPVSKILGTINTISESSFTNFHLIANDIFDTMRNFVKRFYIYSFYWKLEQTIGK